MPAPLEEVWREAADQRSAGWSKALYATIHRASTLPSIGCFVPPSPAGARSAVCYYRKQSLAIIARDRICGPQTRTMNEPERRPHGRLVRQPGGHAAFIPAPLPPPFAWDSELVTALSAADLAIGRLGGEGRRLPNPHVLIRPFVRREAVLSSRIEGTVSGLDDLLAAEAGAPVRRNAADLGEVANCVTAIEYAVERLATLPLSLRLVREAHRPLMTDIRGNAATPGEFRRTQNWIGAPGPRRPPRPTCRRRRTRWPTA